MILCALIQTKVSKNIRFLTEKNLWKIPRVPNILNRVGAIPATQEGARALLEKEEGRPEVLNELMVKRMQVKNKYPKGGENES